MKMAIVGAGLTGLSAADTLSRAGIECHVYEKDAAVGGLAGSFAVNGARLEKFYHHLFTSDHAIIGVIERVGLAEELEWLPTSNSYYAGRSYRLSTPLDLLKFDRISFPDRIRLGLLYLRSLFLREWEPLEEVTARDWLVKVAGERVYHAVWEPLLRAKFGPHADEIAAVWIWNKLKLRGGSRSGRQQEMLGYVRGGFGRVIDAWQERLVSQGVQFHLSTPVSRLVVEQGRVTGVVAEGGPFGCDAVLVTTAPQVLGEIAPDLPAAYRARLDQIEYMANVCLVLKVDRRISDTYWLNVGETEIPFTGYIEHTNMQPPERYGGAHLVYLSRYLDSDDPHYAMSKSALFEEYLPHLVRMFPGFSRDWVGDLWAWRARYAQPIIRRRYSSLRLDIDTPLPNLWLSCMAQVYPEDRGMNYAVQYGQLVADHMLSLSVQ